jgi:hypothetical protein
MEMTVSPPSAFIVPASHAVVETTLPRGRLFFAVDFATSLYVHFYKDSFSAGR